MSEQTAQQAETLSAEEVADRLGISRNTAYAAIQRGEIPAIRIGRLVRVPTRSIDRLLGREPSIPTP